MLSKFVSVTPSPNGVFWQFNEIKIRNTRPAHCFHSSKSAMWNNLLLSSELKDGDNTTRQSSTALRRSFLWSLSLITSRCEILSWICNLPTDILIYLTDEMTSTEPAVSWHHRTLGLRQVPCRLTYHPCPMTRRFVDSHNDQSPAPHTRHD